MIVCVFFDVICLNQCKYTIIKNATHAKKVHDKYGYVDKYGNDPYIVKPSSGFKGIVFGDIRQDLKIHVSTNATPKYKVAVAIKRAKHCKVLKMCYFNDTDGNVCINLILTDKGFYSTNCKEKAVHWKALWNSIEHWKATKCKLFDICI